MAGKLAQECLHSTFHGELPTLHCNRWFRHVHLHFQALTYITGGISIVSILMLNYELLKWKWSWTYVFYSSYSWHHLNELNLVRSPCNTATHVLIIARTCSTCSNLNQAIASGSWSIPPTLTGASILIWTDSYKQLRIFQQSLASLVQCLQGSCLNAAGQHHDKHFGHEPAEPVAITLVTHPAHSPDT